MAKWTIAQCREKDIQKIASLGTIEGAEDKARYIMNSFYRMAALNITISDISNNESLYNRYTKNGRLDKMEARLEKWHKRLEKELVNFGNLKIKWPGLYPIIETPDGRNVTYGYYY